MDIIKKGQKHKPLASLFVVGVTRFELVASSVSGKRSPPELNARSLGLPLSRQQLDSVSDCGNLSKDFSLTGVST